MLRFTLDKVKLRTREILKLLWSFTWAFSRCYSYLGYGILPMQGADASTGLEMDCSWRAVSMVTNVWEYKTIHGWTRS